MQFKAENVDTDRALDYIEQCRNADSEKERIEMVSIQKFHEGVRHGLDVADNIFKCHNFEKKGVPASYDDCVGDAISKIAKELDIVHTDIRTSGKSGEEMCTIFAKRVLSVFERKGNTDNMRDSIQEESNV